jgi:hypothetical protein
LDTARNERIEARKERDEALGKVKALEKMLDYQMDHTNGWSRRALETEAEIADAMEAARIRGASVLDVNGKPKALVVLVSDIMHDLIGKRAVARDVHEVLDRTRGERDEARKRLEQQTDWYQQRFNRLRKWVKEEVEPLSKEVAHRYFSICANGSPAPHESADWTDTMHGLKLRAEQAEKQRDEALFKLAEAKSDIRMLRAHLEAITTEFEATVAHADWRAAGSKGMSVPYHGDFASAVQLPSVISRMRTWAKGFREVLEKTK